MSYCCVSEDSKHGSFKVLGGEMKKGDMLEALKERGLRASICMFSIFFLF